MTNTAPDQPAAAPPPAQLRPEKLFPFVLVLVGFLLYFNTLNNPFIFDDTSNIVAGSRITDLSNPLGLLFNGRRGLPDLTLAINWAIAGDDPRGYHLVNALVHVLASIALYDLARLVLSHRRRDDDHAPRPTPHAPRPAWLAFAIALLWLVHPLCTQAVTYVIQRSEAMMALFYLLTLSCVGRYALSRNPAWAVLAILACFAGMVSKEVMATAPIVALLFDRAFFAGSFAAAARRWPMYLGLTCTWLVFLKTGLGDVIAAETSAGFGMPVVNWWQYLLSQGEVILHYFRLALVPWPLVLDYGWLPAGVVTVPSYLVLHVAIPVAIVLALLVASLVGVARNAWWGFPAFFVFAVLSVTSTIVPIADVAVEHRMYLPLAGIVTLLIVGGSKLLPRLVPLANVATVGAAIVAAVAVVFSGLTVARNAEYGSGVSLWTTVTHRAPDNPRGWHNLGEALGAEGRLDEAMEAYERAISIVPEFADAHHNVGQIWMDRGRPDRALPRFEQAVVSRPDDPESRYGLATALFGVGRTDDALRQLDETLKLQPEMAKAFNLRGTILAQTGDADGAIESFTRAIAINPDNAEAEHNLARTLHHQGRYAESLPHYNRAVELDPENPLYLNSVARLLATAPDDSVRNGRHAVALASQAAVLQQNRDLRTLDTLAAAHAEAGQWDMAASVARHVLQTAGKAGFPPEVLDQLRVRLALYESKQPYREPFAPAAPQAVTPAEPKPPSPPAPAPDAP